MTTIDAPARPTRDGVPPRALVLSGVALGVPVLLAIFAPDVVRDAGLAVWMLPLVPAFLLAYHRGWRGAAWALGAGMAVLALGHAVLALRASTGPEWWILFVMTAVYVAVALGTGALAELLGRERHRAERLAFADSLTGLPNRRHTQISLDASFSGARAGAPLSVILLNIDRFRALNEHHGHEAGDEVLREISAILRRSVRDGEVVGRWGGGEFLVVLPGISGSRALERAEAMRAAVRDAPLRWQPVTVSAGVAEHGSDTPTSDALVSVADDALRRVKVTGRDRVAAHATPATAERNAPLRASPDPSLLARRPATAPAPLPQPARDGDPRQARIVVVDDEVPNLRAFGRALRALGYERVETFEDPLAAVDAIEKEPPDLILLDLQMPRLDGFQVLERLRPLLQAEGFLPVVILTGERDPEVRGRALRAGGKDFLNKPVDLTELEARIVNLLEARALHRALTGARDRLEERVRERTRELEDARVEILRRLARAAEYRDDATGRHQERVGLLSERLGSRMGMPAEDVSVLRLAAPLHDVGKIAIPDGILRKPGPLTDEEFRRMQEHCRIGAELLSGSPHRVLEEARIIALTHHERWDGRGYPAGLSAEAIPLTGRIVAVADVFDSLSHQRPYKDAWPYDKVMTVIGGEAGMQFDPRAVRALQELGERGLLDDLLGD